jgi:hypothetical protein
LDFLLDLVATQEPLDEGTAVEFEEEFVYL